MRNYKAFVALLCLCAVAVNPVVAATLPCCCTERAEGRDCCHQGSAKSSQTKKSYRGCCQKRPVTRNVAKQPCGCCSKANPQAILAKDVAVKTNIDLGSMFWLPRYVFVLAEDQSQQNVDAHQVHPTGMPLLALYCRWLE